MASAQLALACGKGETVTFNGTHQTSASNTTAIDITGWTIKMTVRDDSGTIVLQKTASITSGAAGTYALACTHAETLLPIRVYDADIWRTDTASEKLLANGTFAVTDEVLYP
jgi:hypothetical protein